MGFGEVNVNDPQFPFVNPDPNAPLWRRQARWLRRRLIRQRMIWAPTSRRKEWNSALNWREFWHGQTRLDSFPRVIQVGTNWTCNLRCAFCRLTMPWTREEMHKRPSRELQLSEHVVETIKRLLPYAEMMTLTPLGEPLLWGGLKDLLEYHARLGSHNLALTSNGMLLDDAMAERLVRGQLSRLFLSIDSNDPGVYASMRVGGNLRAVEAGIQRVNLWKKRLNVPWPALTLNATFMARNIGQLPSMVAWAKLLGFEEISVQLMEMENPELEPEFLGHHPDLAREGLERALERGREIGFRVVPHPALLSLIAAAGAGRNVADHQYQATSPIMPEAVRQAALAGAHDDATPDPARSDEMLADPLVQCAIPPKVPGKVLVEKCAFPWYNLLIDTDGDVRPCCWADVSWGNLNKLSFEEIWNSSKAQAMRRLFLRNVTPRSCRKKHCRVDL